MSGLSPRFLRAWLEPWPHGPAATRLALLCFPPCAQPTLSCRAGSGLSLTLPLAWERGAWFMAASLCPAAPPSQARPRPLPGPRTPPGAPLSLLWRKVLRTGLRPSSALGTARRCLGLLMG